MSRFSTAIVATVIVVAAAHAADHNAGRKIYVSGEGQNAITVSLAGGSELPATMLPCVNCHGADGRGNVEGGVTASNITWLELTKPYRAATPNGRRRPAYNELTLRRAITEGIDSAGNPLHAAMPRYALSEADLANLVAYLNVLGRESVPGVTETSVRIGTIVPQNAAGTQMATVMTAYFSDAGEIHGRRISLETMTPAALEANPPFALAGGVADATIEQAVERAEVPLVLPMSLRGSASADNRQRFYLSPGLEEQIRGLLKYKNVSRLKVIASDEELRAAAERASKSAVPVERPALAGRNDNGGLKPAAPQDDGAAVLFLDPTAKLADIPAGDAPLLFLGNLLPSDFFKEAPRHGKRITVALTTTPADLAPDGVAEYRAFAIRHRIPNLHFAAQVSAYAAAKVLVHALKLSGRELTRDALRASLESLYEFHTGMTPPLTYGRSRRIGAPRIHAATIDPANGSLVPVGTFTTD